MTISTAVSLRRDPVVAAYIECALWSSTDERGVPLEDLPYEIPTTTYEQLAEDVHRFIAKNAGLLIGIPDEQIGHDLWLTRNGHGAGFWDRGLGERGDKLTKAAEALGEQLVYIGDDDRLYVL